MEDQNYQEDVKLPKLYVFRGLEVEKVEPIGNWQKNIKCPDPRSGHRMVVYKGNIFAFGGYSPRNTDTNEIIIPPNNRHLFKELWKFNFATKTWTNLETFGEVPSEVASHSALLIDNFMLVYGGTGVPFGQSSSNSTHLCNLDTLEWFTLDTTGEVPPPLYGQAVALYKNKMYVIGGTSGFIYSLTVHCLDLSSLKWFRLDMLKEQRYEPPARYRHEILVYDDKIYVFGGGTSTESFGFKEIPVFDIEECMWDTVKITSKDYPSSRLCHGCVQIDDCVYMFGGHDNFRIFSDIWKFDLKASHWSKLKISLPTPLHFHSVSVSSEGEALIFGGVTDTQEEVRTNNVYSMWLKIPSLTEMCWKALTLYVPHIGQIDKLSLFEVGVPVYYLSQLDYTSTLASNQNIKSIVAPC